MRLTHAAQIADEVCGPASYKQIGKWGRSLARMTSPSGESLGGGKSVEMSVTPKDERVVVVRKRQKGLGHCALSWWHWCQLRGKIR